MVHPVFFFRNSVKDDIQSEHEWRLSDAAVDTWPVIFDHEVVETRWKELKLELCIVLSLITDRNFFVIIIIVNMKTHLVDSLSVFIDACIDWITFTIDLERKWQDDLFIGLLGYEYAFVLGDVGWNQSHVLPPITVFNEMDHVSVAHGECFLIESKDWPFDFGHLVNGMGKEVFDALLKIVSDSFVIEFWEVDLEAELNAISFTHLDIFDLFMLTVAVFKNLNFVEGVRVNVECLYSIYALCSSNLRVASSVHQHPLTALKLSQSDHHKRSFLL